MRNKGHITNRGFTISELLLVFLIVFVVGCTMIPFIQHNQKSMDKTVCANNLREIGLALYIYARENNGTFPASIETLYEEQYLADNHLLDCPATKKEGTVGESEYIYASGLSVRSPSERILFWDKSQNHAEDGRNVMYVSGVVEWEQ